MDATSDRAREVDRQRDTDFDFTEDWFSQHIPVWSQLIPTLPSHETFLEIGSFEGRSACWMLQNALDRQGRLYCIDTWNGSPEFWGLSPDVVARSYDRFVANIRIAKGPEQRVHVFRHPSVLGLAHLLAESDSSYIGRFDLIYIDGGHRAADTMTDACMAWPLLKPKGLMIFDDVLWDLDQPVTERPKLAIDVFTTLFFDQLVTEAVGHQWIVRKRGGSE